MVLLQVSVLHSPSTHVIGEKGMLVAYNPGIVHESTFHITSRQKHDFYPTSLVVALYNCTTTLESVHYHTIINNTYARVNGVIVDLHPAIPRKGIQGVAGKQYSSTFHFSTLLVHSAVPGTARHV